MGEFLFGTSSWSEKSWEGVFYPSGTPPGEHLPARRGARSLALARALARLAAARRGLVLAAIDGRPPSRSPVASALVEAGFTSSSRGLVRNPPIPTAFRGMSSSPK